MSRPPLDGPQNSRLFRLVAFFSRLRFAYLLRRLGHRRLLTWIFLFGAGVTALGTITCAAYLTGLMLLFPPLGPSAFILFYTPLAETASPRNVIGAHGLALAAGLIACGLAQLAIEPGNVQPADAMNWQEVAAVALAMGLVSLAMVAGRCVHPPAAATALIAALGYLETWVQVGSVLMAVIVLVLEAVFFNRILGGLPYPLWRHDPQRVKHYGALAGQTDPAENRWQLLATKTFQRR